MLGQAHAHVPIKNRGGYRETAENSAVGDKVIVILRSRRTQLGKVMPTLWEIASKHFDQSAHNSIGYLLLTSTGIAF